MPNTLVQLGGIIVMGNWNKLLVSFSWDFCSDRCQKSLSVENFGHFSGENFTLCPVSCLPESPMCRLIAQNQSLRYVWGLASEVWLHDSSLSGWKAPQKACGRWKVENGQKLHKTSFSGGWQPSSHNCWYGHFGPIGKGNWEIYPCAERDYACTSMSKGRFSGSDLLIFH